MSRLADALHRAGEAAWSPVAPHVSADDWLRQDVRGSAGLPVVRSAAARRGTEAAERPAPAAVEAYERIARFLIEACEQRGARVVLCTAVRPTRACSRAVIGAAAAAARLRAAPVGVLDAARETAATPHEISVVDIGRDVRVATGVPGAALERRRWFDALTREFGLLLVHGPAAPTAAAALLATQVDATLVFAPLSGAGVRPAVEHLNRARVHGIVGIADAAGVPET